MKYPGLKQEKNKEENQKRVALQIGDLLLIHWYNKEERYQHRHYRNIAMLRMSCKSTQQKKYSLLLYHYSSLKIPNPVSYQRTDIVPRALHSNFSRKKKCCRQTPRHQK